MFQRISFDGTPAKCSAIVDRLYDIELFEHLTGSIDGHNKD